MWAFVSSLKCFTRDRAVVDASGVVVDTQLAFQICSHVRRVVWHRFTLTPPLFFPCEFRLMVPRVNGHVTG